jgi:hypothetical protein
METGQLRIRIAADPPDLTPGELSVDELESVSGGAYTPPSIYPP